MSSSPSSIEVLHQADRDATESTCSNDSSHLGTKPKTDTTADNVDPTSKSVREVKTQEIMQQSEGSTVEEDGVGGMLTSGGSGGSVLGGSSGRTSTTLMHTSGASVSGGSSGRTTLMQESSSSGSLVNSVILNKTDNMKYDTDGSIQNSPAKRDGRWSEDDSVYQSCHSSDEQNLDSHRENSTSHVDSSGVGTSLIGTTPTPGDNLSELESTTHAITTMNSSATMFDSLSSTPRTIRSRAGSLGNVTSTPFAKQVKRVPFGGDSTNSLIQRSKSDLTDLHAASEASKFFSAENSPNRALRSSPSRVAELSKNAEEMKYDKPYRKAHGPIKWNTDDFTQVDHRIRLYCEINLFHQETEELLIVAKGELFVKSQASLKLFSGLLVVTNKSIYILNMADAVSEEPSDWLEQVASAPVHKLQRIVQLLGGQGVALELQVGDSKPPSMLYFSRIGGSGYAGRMGGLEGYHLVLADANVTKTLIDQMVDLLQERVRSNPIPVVKELNQEEEQLLAKQLKTDPEENVPAIASFQLAYSSSGKLISVICTSDGIVLATNFFAWLYADRACAMPIHSTLPAHQITQLEIYQSMPESLTIRLDQSVHHLTFQCEKGLQKFVCSLRSTWEKQTEKSLEEIVGFHPTGSTNLLKMTAFMEESVSFKDFDFSQWIKVTSIK